MPLRIFFKEGLSPQGSLDFCSRYLRFLGQRVGENSRTSAVKKVKNSVNVAVKNYRR
jgi:hypothetical protein